MEKFPNKILELVTRAIYIFSKYFNEKTYHSQLKNLYKCLSFINKEMKWSNFINYYFNKLKILPIRDSKELLTNDYIKYNLNTYNPLEMYENFLCSDSVTIYEILRSKLRDENINIKKRCKIIKRYIVLSSIWLIALTCEYQYEKLWSILFDNYIYETNHIFDILIYNFTD